MLKIEVDIKKELLDIEGDGKGFELMAEIPYMIKGIIVCLKEMGMDQEEAEEYTETAFRVGIGISRKEEEDGTLDN